MSLRNVMALGAALALLSCGGSSGGGGGACSFTLTGGVSKTVACASAIAAPASGGWGLAIVGTGLTSPESLVVGAVFTGGSTPANGTYTLATAQSATGIIYTDSTGSKAWGATGGGGGSLSVTITGSTATGGGWIVHGSLTATMPVLTGGGAPINATATF